MVDMMSGPFMTATTAEEIFGDSVEIGDQVTVTDLYGDVHTGELTDVGYTHSIHHRHVAVKTTNPTAEIHIPVANIATAVAH